jgi:hypothetical protein
MWKNNGVKGAFRTATFALGVLALAITLLLSYGAKLV